LSRRFGTKGEGDVMMFSRTSSLRVLTAGLAIAVLGGCGAMNRMRGGGTEFPMTTSPDIPAAKGNVSVNTQDDGQQKFRLRVKHLAPVENLGQQAASYVVWLRPAAGDQRPLNLGVLTVKDDRSADFQGTTPFREFDIFVTAESSPRVTQPSQTPMLRASIQPKGPAY
jgi:hypothetical protein